MKGRDLKKHLLKILLAGTAIFLAACLHSDGPTGPTCDNLTAGATQCDDCDPTNPEHLACQDTFTNAVFPILELHCVGCHVSGSLYEQITGGPDSGMIYDDPSIAYDRLLMPSAGDQGATMRVVAGDPSASAFYNKISADNETVWYGDPMPLGNALVNDYPEAVETIRLWIEAGAKGPAAAPKP